MGIAAYGEPERLEAFRDIVRFDANGSSNGFRLGLGYFVHHRTGPELRWGEADKTPTLGKLFAAERCRGLVGRRGASKPLSRRPRTCAGCCDGRRRCFD